MYEMIKKFPWSNTDAGLLVLRIGVAAIFILTGWMKVSDMHTTVAFFATLGFGTFWAYLVTAVELLGGIAVLLGFYTRIAAKLLAITMIVALIVTFYVVHGGITVAMTPFLMFFATVSLVLSGPGKYAVKE